MRIRLEFRREVFTSIASENAFAGIELSSANGTADGMKLFDERGNYAGEMGKPPEPTETTHSTRQEASEKEPRRIPHEILVRKTTAGD